MVKIWKKIFFSNKKWYLAVSRPQPEKANVRGVKQITGFGIRNYEEKKIQLVFKIFF